MNRLGSFHGRIEDLTEEATGLRSPLPLFDRFSKPAAPFVQHDQSVAAAEKIEPHADKQRRVVLAVITAAGSEGMTRQELEVTGLSPDSIRPRVWELIKSGDVVESLVQTRKTRSGRDAAVLLAVKA